MKCVASLFYDVTYSESLLDIFSRFRFLSKTSQSKNPKKSEEFTKASINNIEAVIAERQGLLIMSSEKLLNFTASHYTDAEVFAARHINELKQLHDSIYIRLDAAQRGLGTGSCGPQTLAQYQVNGGSHRISFWIKPVGF